MDQEMMQHKHELKEFIEHGQHLLQKMEGSMGQRYYGMRGGMGYKDDEWMDEDEMHERRGRRRDSRGRYM